MMISSLSKDRFPDMPAYIKEAPLTDFEKYNDLGVFYINHEKYDDAIKALNRSLKIKPDYGPALENMGLAYLRKRDHQNAHEYLKKAEKIMPDSPTLLNTLGSLYRDIGKYQEAIKYFDMAFKIDPTVYDAIYNKALTLEDMGDIQEAKKVWNKYIRHASKVPQEFAYVEAAKERLKKLERGRIGHEKKR